jgi:hypothetical protein
MVRVMATGHYDTRKEDTRATKAETRFSLFGQDYREEGDRQLEYDRFWNPYNA